MIAPHADTVTVSFCSIEWPEHLPQVGLRAYTPSASELPNC
jgi:hypothetical protein